MKGKTFGRWLVLYEVGRTKHKKILWKCICTCGTIKSVVGGNLKSGISKSCGCLAKELQASRPHNQRSHGHATGGKTSPTYQSWRAMHQRCECPKNKDYHSYGGRGIMVMPTWFRFESFLEDMGERPSTEYSLDRINPDMNYEPSNCQWITKTENSRKGNRERSRLLGRIPL